MHCESACKPQRTRCILDHSRATTRNHFKMQAQAQHRSVKILSGYVRIQESFEAHAAKIT